jgi:hypothetical protein
LQLATKLSLTNSLGSINIELSAPLFAATFNGHANIMRILLSLGTDLSVTNSSGETPLDIARSKWWNEVVNCWNLPENQARTKIRALHCSWHYDPAETFMVILGLVGLTMTLFLRSYGGCDIWKVRR